MPDSSPGDAQAPWYRWEGDTLILRIHLQPRACRDSLNGPYGDRLKISITAPPVEGAANHHLIRFLAKTFRVPASQITLRSGMHARQKCVAIHAPRTLPVAMKSA